MHLFKSLVLIGAAASLGICGEVPKTLPVGFYTSAKSGKKMDLVQIDPSFDKSKGFVYDGKVEQLSENRISALADLISSQIKTVASDGSPYKLRIALVESSNKTYAVFGYIDGKASVEGDIVDAAGKSVASFRVRVSIPEGMGGSDYRAAADKIVTAILKDLK